MKKCGGFSEWQELSLLVGGNIYEFLSFITFLNLANTYTIRHSFIILQGYNFNIIKLECFSIQPIFKKMYTILRLKGVFR